MIFRTLLSLLFLSLCSSTWAVKEENLKKIKTALLGFESVNSPKPPQVLVYSHPSGFAHKSIPTGIKALRELSQKTRAFTAEFSTSVDDFSIKNLQKYQGIIFNNTTRVEKAFVTDDQRSALLHFIKSGKGFSGFHGASDAGMPKWPEYTDMIGGCFDGHPWNAGGTWPFTVEDPTHPLSQSFTNTTFKFSDEIYQYKGYNRNNLRVLISLDAKKSGKFGKSPTHDYPVSWVKNYGKGRVFYSNFGHNKATWWTPYLLKHFLHGIRWSLGDVDGPTESLQQPAQNNF